MRTLRRYLPRWDFLEYPDWFTDKEMEPCHSCGQSFPDFRELALHISGAKKGHRKGKAWASKYLLRSSLTANHERRERIPISDEDREAKTNTRMELSGEMSYVRVKCPKCKRVYPRTVEVEYVNSKLALRDNGVLMITCQNCGGPR